jgi:ribosomal protein S18 acetylase RimI-like enzyme
VTVRPATEEDLTAIGRVAERSWRVDYADILTRERVETAVNDWYEPESLAAELADDRTLLPVADRDGIVGFAHATRTGPDGHLLRLYVLPEHRREGVGRALLTETTERLRERGVERVHAMVLAANEPGQRFYEWFGFERVAAGTTEIGEERHEEYRYRHDDPGELVGGG